MADLIKKNSAKRNLALNYLLPVFCVLTFATSNTAKAAKDNHDKKNYKSGIYAGFAIGMIEANTNNSSFAFTSKHGACKHTNLHQLAMGLTTEFVLGYTMTFGNFLLPAELYSKSGLLAVPNNTADNANAVRAKYNNTAAGDGAMNNDLHYQASLGLRIRPGFAVNEDFSVHAILGVDYGVFSNLSAKTAYTALSGIDTKILVSAIGGSYGAGIEYKMTGRSFRIDWITTVFPTAPVPSPQTIAFNRTNEGAPSPVNDIKVSDKAPTDTMPVVLSSFLIGVSVYPFAD